MPEAKTAGQALPDSRPNIKTKAQSSPESFENHISNFVATTEDRQRNRQEKEDRLLDEWRTPIEFSGKVVNEEESPVQGAQIDFSCNDLSASGTSFYHATSDSQGLFSIKGIQGKLLTVKVSKSGYYTSKRDNDSFYYSGLNVNFKANAAIPMVFHLRKKGRGETLVAFKKSFRVPKDGTPVEIDLIKGVAVPTGQGHLRIECRTEKPEARGAKYDWKCRVSVPGGGLALNIDEFGFLAPADGYENFDQIDMLTAVSERWQSNATRNYFVHTASGYFGRLNFEMISGGDHFCVIESALNPSAGSRNLEFDESAQPAKPDHFE